MAGSYTVRGSEDLQAIAQSLSGDRQMWYLLAEANGLRGDEGLAPGQVLVIPNKINNIHNNAETFRPYSAGEAIGRIDPSLRLIDNDTIDFSGLGQAHRPCACHELQLQALVGRPTPHSAKRARVMLLVLLLPPTLRRRERRARPCAFRSSGGGFPQDAGDTYRCTCLASVGDAGALVDLALSTGLAPHVGGPEGDTATASLLGDAPGQVYGVPGSNDVLLAIGDDGRCTVWANRTDGPKLKQAFVTALDALRQSGATVKPVRDRTVQRGGGWRQQIGYEVSDTRGAFSADAVTLLTPQPGTQVLRAAPSGRRAAAKELPQSAASKPAVSR